MKDLVSQQSEIKLAGYSPNISKKPGVVVTHKVKLSLPILAKQIDL